MDTIKLITYRAETSMASVMREAMTRSDDTRKRFTTGRFVISATSSTPPIRSFQVRIYARFTKSAHVNFFVDQEFRGYCSVQ